MGAKCNLNKKLGAGKSADDPRLCCLLQRQTSGFKIIPLSRLPTLVCSRVSDLWALVSLGGAIIKSQSRTPPPPLPCLANFRRSCQISLWKRGDECYSTGPPGEEQLDYRPREARLVVPKVCHWADHFFSRGRRWQSRWRWRKIGGRWLKNEKGEMRKEVSEVKSLGSSRDELQTKGNSIGHACTFLRKCSRFLSITTFSHVASSFTAM